MLKVNLEASIHLHDFFADYPLAPEKQIVSENWISPYNEKLIYVYVPYKIAILILFIQS